jgi:hypothetical protein
MSLPPGVVISSHAGLQPPAAGKDIARTRRRTKLILRHSMLVGVRPPNDRCWTRGPDMADIVNLNQFRKKRDRRDAERQAAANRERFGQRKDTRSKTARELEKAKKDLDDKQIE